MKLSIKSLLTYVVFILIGVFHGNARSGEDTQLFGASDIVSPGAETSLLTSAEVTHLNFLRNNPSLYQIVRVVRLNRLALNGTVVTVASPEGKEYTYRGSATKGATDKFYIWRGNSARGYMVISYDEKGIAGEFREDGHIYEILSLKGGRIQILTEAQKLGDLQESPSMSGKEDPPEFRHSIRPLPPQPGASAKGGSL